MIIIYVILFEHRWWPLLLVSQWSRKRNSMAQNIFCLFNLHSASCSRSKPFSYKSSWTTFLSSVICWFSPLLLYSQRSWLGETVPTDIPVQPLVRNWIFLPWGRMFRFSYFLYPDHLMLGDFWWSRKTIILLIFAILLLSHHSLSDNATVSVKSITQVWFAAFALDAYMA